MKMNDHALTLGRHFFIRFNQTFHTSVTLICLCYNVKLKLSYLQTVIRRTRTPKIFILNATCAKYDNRRF